MLKHMVKKMNIFPIFFLTACATISATPKKTMTSQEPTIARNTTAIPSERIENGAVKALFVLHQFGEDWIVFPDAAGRKGFQLACAAKRSCDARETPEACAVQENCETVQYYAKVEAGQAQFAIFSRGDASRLFNQRWRVRLGGRFLCLDTGKPADFRHCERVEMLQNANGRTGIILVLSRPHTDPKIALR